MDVKNGLFCAAKDFFAARNEKTRPRSGFLQRFGDQAA